MNGGGNGQFNHTAGAGEQPQPVNHQVGSPYVLPRQQTSQNQGNQNMGNGNHNESWQITQQRQHDQGMSGGNGNSSSTLAGTAHGTGAGNNGNGQRSTAGVPAGSLVVNGQHTVTRAGGHHASR